MGNGQARIRQRAAGIILRVIKKAAIDATPDELTSDIIAALEEDNLQFTLQD